MKLYKIITYFWGKDLNEQAFLGYLVKTSDEEVYEHINEEYKGNDWPESVNMDREDIINQKGDFDSGYMGEFYDQKYGWEEVGEITLEQITCLEQLSII